MSFAIGSRAPRTRRGQLGSIFSHARKLGLDNADVLLIATALLGREILSLSETGSFSDREVFLLWAAFQGHSEIHSAHMQSGNGIEFCEKVATMMEDGEDVTDDLLERLL